MNVISRRNFQHMILTASSAIPGFAQDWPQWRGSERDGAAPAANGPAAWPEKLKQSWRIAVGEGHSSPVVQGDRVYQFARLGDREMASAHELASGKKLWEAGMPVAYEMNSAAREHGKGPKSTPVIAAGRLYTFGIAGSLICRDASSGKQIWAYDSAANWRETSPTFGTAMSPILIGSDLIAHVGTDKNGALTAFDAQSGKIRWQWKGEGPAYSSPVLAKAGAVTHLVTFSAEKVIGVNPSSGALLWQLPFTTPYTQNSVTPFVIGDTVIYSGLSSPVTSIRLTSKGPEQLWENRELGMYMSSPVLSAGLLHGLSHRNKGQLFSLDPKTGKTAWTSDGRQGENAMLISRGDTVFVLTTDAELHVMRASSKGLAPVRKYTVANSPTWAHPVVIGNRILVKDEESLALWNA